MVVAGRREEQLEGMLREWDIELERRDGASVREEARSVDRMVEVRASRRIESAFEEFAISPVARGGSNRREEARPANTARVGSSSPSISR